VQVPIVAKFDGSVLDATGYVVARRQATVSSEVTGQVVDVYIEEGQRVAANELLARLDDSIPRAQLELVESQLAAARASLTEIEVQLRQAELDLERTTGLASRQLASQADLDRDSLAVDGLRARLERARRDVVVAERTVTLQRRALDDMEVRAPFDGVVVAKAAQPGEIVSPMSAGGGFTRTGICTIVDMESLEVEVDVNEAYINRVTPGQPARITLNAYPETPFRAEVIAIIPTADRNKATVRVRIAFLERDDRVLPDMGVKVAFLEAPEEAAT
jgi:RND family efflux transporter MFP subunit